MGILNVTPDSFSDGGEYYIEAVANAKQSTKTYLENNLENNSEIKTVANTKTNTKTNTKAYSEKSSENNLSCDSSYSCEDSLDNKLAYEYAMTMISYGASIIDIGGESTRPGAQEVSEAEELRRILPVIKKLADQGVPVSVDTRHASVAKAAVCAGASIINDVSGFRNPEMVAVAKDCNAGLIVMHMLGEPQNMQENPKYCDVVKEVSEYLLQQAKMLEGAGIKHERIAIDPGPGFGKDYAHNMALLRATASLAKLGYPLVAAWSRKRFVGELTGEKIAKERVAGSVAVAAWAAANKASILRVHDVKPMAQALAALNAIVAD
jgi:dihydropteroate synthase